MNKLSKLLTALSAQSAFEDNNDIASANKLVVTQQNLDSTVVEQLPASFLTSHQHALAIIDAQGGHLLSAARHLKAVPNKDDLPRMLTEFFKKHFSKALAHHDSKQSEAADACQHILKPLSSLFDGLRDRTFSLPPEIAEQLGHAEALLQPETADPLEIDAAIAESEANSELLRAFVVYDTGALISERAKAIRASHQTFDTAVQEFHDLVNSIDGFCGQSPFDKPASVDQKELEYLCECWAKRLPEFKALLVKVKATKAKFDEDRACKTFIEKRIGKHYAEPLTALVGPVQLVSVAFLRRWGVDFFGRIRALPIKATTLDKNFNDKAMQAFCKNLTVSCDMSDLDDKLIPDFATLPPGKPTIGDVKQSIRTCCASMYLWNKLASAYLHRLCDLRSKIYNQENTSELLKRIFACETELTAKDSYISEGVLEYHGRVEAYSYPMET